MQNSWPEKKEHGQWCNRHKKCGYECNCGANEWNACIDAHEPIRREVEGKKEINMDRDKLYAAFTSGQRQHDCPGFDCAECSHCFDLLFEELESHPQLVSVEEIARIIISTCIIGQHKYIQDVDEPNALEAAKAIFSKMKK